MLKLTKKQIERQDFVDNQIFKLIQEILPPQKRISWNIEVIGAIRDAIQKQIVNKKKMMSKIEFYP